MPDVEILRGRIVRREPHQSGAFWRYHARAFGTQDTDIIFLAEQEIPIASRVEFNRDMVQAVDVDGDQRVFAISTFVTSDARVERSWEQMPWEWPEIQPKPQQRIQSWAKREAQRVGMRLRFEQGSDGVWSIIVDTERGEVVHVLMPGTPWADALEAVGLEP